MRASAKFIGKRQTFLKVSAKKLTSDIKVSWGKAKVLKESTIVLVMGNDNSFFHGNVPFRVSVQNTERKHTSSSNGL